MTVAADRRGPPAGLSIRPSLAIDAEVLAAIANDFNAPVNGGVTPMTAALVRDDWLGDGPFGVLVAALEGRPVDYALHGPACESAYAARGRFLNNLAVAQPHRRRGIGRALIARVATETRAEGGTFLWWVNAEGLPLGRPLYRRIADVEDRMTAFAVTQQGSQTLAEKGAAA